MAKSKTTPADYIEERDGYATITLASPATIGGELVDTLRMREPTVGDAKAARRAKGDEEERETIGIANLCEITPKEVDGLTLRNFGRVQEAFQRFTV